MKNENSLQVSLAQTSPALYGKFDGCKHDCLTGLVCKKIRNPNSATDCPMEENDMKFLELLKMYIESGRDMIYL